MSWRQNEFPYTCITVAFPQECFLNGQPQLPSFHPSRHLSSTRLQSNSGFPVFLFTWLCNLHIHWESSSRDDVCGLFVFSLEKGRGNYRTLIRYETLFKTALTMLCFKKNPLTLYGDPRHNSHRGRILRIDEWTGTCRSVDWAWVCRGSRPPWCGGMPRYSGPGCPYLADKASLPLSSYFPFFSGRKIIQYNIALYLNQLGISFVFFKHFARKSNCFHLNVMAARYTTILNFHICSCSICAIRFLIGWQFACAMNYETCV